MMKKWSFLLVASLLLSACSNDTEKVVDEQSHEEHVHSMGDIQEETASAEVLPSAIRFNECPKEVSLFNRVKGEAQR